MRALSSFYRLTAKLMVFMMLIQGLPMLELGRAWQWDFANYAKRISRILQWLSPDQAHAAEITENGIFGPQQYVRTKGAPNVYEDVFAATPGPGRLVIQNGEPDGAHRVTAALIYVNDVFRTEEFCVSNPKHLEIGFDVNRF